MSALVSTPKELARKARYYREHREAILARQKARRIEKYQAKKARELNRIDQYEKRMMERMARQCYEKGEECEICSAEDKPLQLFHLNDNFEIVTLCKDCAIEYAKYKRKRYK